MKKLVIFAVTLVSLTSIAYAAKDSAECTGSNKFLKNLHLEQSRADQVHDILYSYSEIKTLYKNKRHDEIPSFLARKEAELAAVLTPEELAQFKSDVAAWAENKDFPKFMRFSSMGNWTDKNSD